MTETLTYAQAFQRAMRDEMQRDSSIFVLGTDLFVRGGHFAQVKGLGAEFGPERVRDTPISEAAMVSAGIGAAMNGMRPVVDLNFADFALGAMDEIVNQAAKIRYMLGYSVPLVIRGSSGVGLFAAQHTNTVESWFAQVPGLIVATPATPADAGGLLVRALRGSDPVILLMHKRLSSIRGEVETPIEPLEYGSAKVVREGSDITLVTYSFMLHASLEAAEKLAAEGISVEVVDLRTVAPLDRATILASVRKTGHVLLVSDAPAIGGILSEVATGIQEAAFDYLDAPIRRLAGKHAPIPHSPPLFEHLTPGLDEIVVALRELAGVSV
jgi:pyruvate/2-oxoglutarate/acetoin dehydrogenase E1 component